MTSVAANSLAQVEKEINSFGLGLKIYDAYRPQRAVAHFVRWAQKIEDTRMKKVFYPDVDKKDLFQLGFIAEKSSHSRGSTVDLTLFDLKTGRDLDMGSGFDFFGPISHHVNPYISSGQLQNRITLKSVMVRHRFVPLALEWWHYTLENEPFPKKYFDFVVK